MSSQRVVASLVVVPTAGALLYRLYPILTPFFVAAVLSYFANPLVTRLVSWRLPRSLAVVVIFALGVAALAAVPVFLVPIVYRRLAVFAQKLPQYLGWVEHNLLPRPQRLTDRPLPIDFDDLRAPRPRCRRAANYG